MSGFGNQLGKPVSALFSKLSRLHWRVLSVPIYLKVAGIGALVAILFGSATILQVRSTVSLLLYRNLQQETLFRTRAIARVLSTAMLTDDVLSVSQYFRKALDVWPDIRYVIARDSSGKVVAHTFQRAVPEDILRLFPQSISPAGEMRVFAENHGLIFDAVVSIANGYGGSLELGTSDKMIRDQLAEQTRYLLLVLLACMIIGAGLAWTLTQVLTRPIQHLVEVTNEIRRGDFGSRARIFCDDETGHLARAFNEMAQSLEDYKKTVGEKEEARLSLLQKIVQAQEDERKNISRELHDELGQSLSALLLTVQTHRDLPTGLQLDFGARIGHLINEIRRLTSGMRPAVLDDYGLDPALQQLIAQTSDHCGIRIDYQYISPPDQDRVPSQIEVTIYRIVQEALTNIVRHAQTNHASVVVLRAPQSITALIEDTGVGFDLPEVERAGAFLGLSGIKERAELCGGVCALESAPGKGTTIRVKIPLGEESHGRQNSDHR